MARSNKPAKRVDRSVDLYSIENMMCQIMVMKGYSMRCIQERLGFSPGKSRYRCNDKRIKEGLEPLKIRDYRDGHNAVARYDIENNIKSLRKMGQTQLKLVYKQLGFG